MVSALAKALEKDYNIKIIEYSTDRARHLSEKLNKTVVLNGSATDQELLLDENIDKTDVFLALTNDDEVNIHGLATGQEARCAQGHDSDQQPRLR